MLSRKETKFLRETLHSPEPEPWDRHHPDCKKPEETVSFVCSGSGGAKNTVLPSDAKTRKAIPITSGCLDYFPAALAAVAEVSRVGNDQHNPGEPLHWTRGKSNDHADCVARHLVERGTIDTDGARHSAKMAWRALALLQLELEAAGAPVARGAKV